MIEGAAPTGTMRAAQHCEELLSNSLETVDVAAEFARFGTRLARALQPRLAVLFDVRKLETELADTSSCSVEELPQALGETMHHARFSLPGKALGIIASARVSAVIGEFDRMLGGAGEGPPEAAALPSSANRFARQIEAELLAACSEATGRVDLSAAERGSDLGEIVPSSAQSAIHTASIEVSRPGLPKLVLTFSTCEASFVQFAGGEACEGKPVRRSIGEGGIDNSAIGQVELSTTATLVDMEIPLHRIVAMQVGTMVPVPIQRSVPLSISDITIARGTVGTLDDCVALEILQIVFTRDN